MPLAGRILLADDDADFRLVAWNLLQRAGYECHLAADANQARELLAKQPFDLLVCDIQMPGNTSLELIQGLPQVAQGLPVILLTGHPTVQSAMQSVRLPVVAYLVKPPEPDEFLALVSQAVANSHACQAVATNRQRLSTWLHDLEGIEQALKSSPADKNAAPLEACLGLTLDNLLAAMLDMKRMTELLAQRRDQGQSLQEAALIQALQETIVVLEKSRQSFKSKELGELRRKLEGIVPKQS